MRWVVWWSLGVLAACGKSESHPNDPGSTTGGSPQGGSTTAGTAGSSAGTVSTSGSTGRGGHAGASGSSNAAAAGAAAVGGASGNAGSGSSAGGTGGGAGSTAGESSSAGGAAGEPGGAGMSGAGAPGEQCGELVECGCGCCGGIEPSRTLCYYPERGDTLEALRAADAMAANDPSCPSAGCSAGTRRVCCETPAGDDGAGTYSASGYSGGLDHLTIFREGPPGHCTALELSAPTGTDRPFAIDLPAHWHVMVAVDGACGVDGPPTGTVRSAIGGIGSVQFVGDQCNLAVDATLFFVTDGGAVDAVRLLAANLPAEGPLACQ